MKTEITRQEAYDILNKYIKQDYIKYHSIESEAIMKALAKHFGENEEFWWITGLLHDLDMDVIWENYDNHWFETIKILKFEWYDIPVMFKAILSHCECLETPDVKRETNLEFALAAAEQTTWVITAYARMRPEKFANMEVSSLTKKFKDKSFAAKVSREFINDIEKIGLARWDFFKIAIEAIQAIWDQIKFD